MSLFLLTGYKLGFHGLMVSTVEEDPLAQGQSGFKFSVGEQFCRGLQLVVQRSGSVRQKSKVRVFFVFIALLDDVLHSLDHSLSKPVRLGVH